MTSVLAFHCLLDSNAIESSEIDLQSEAQENADRENPNPRRSG